MQRYRETDSDILIQNTCSRTKIARCFRPLIEAAAQTYNEVLADRVVSIRLLGSVARGEAVIGQSDIDFMGLLDTMPPATALQALQQHAKRLRQVYPLVARVDLEAVPIADLSAFQRLVLSSDSLHLYGIDTLTQPEQTMDRAELAALVTPNPLELIQGYRAAVQGIGVGHDDETLRLYSRVTGKDLLKCLRAIALRRGGAYEKSIERIYDQVTALVPEYWALADKLIALYRHPITDRDAVLAVLADADEQLRSTFQHADAITNRDR